MKTLTRVVTVAAARPVDAEWKSITPTLKNLWVASTNLANWSLYQLMLAEQPRLSSQEKMAKFPNPYVYGEFAGYPDREFWKGATQNASAIMQAVRKVWITRRFAVLWQRRQAPPLFRFPYPYRIHNQNWRLIFDQEGRPIFSAGLPGERLAFVLRSGQEYRRQIGQLRQICEGRAKGCEAMLTKNRRTGQTEVRIVGQFPLAESAPGTKTVTVKTGPERLWTAELEGSEQWLLNADQLKSWIVGHLNYLQRISEDTKFEKRWPANMRRNINQARELRCEKQHNRIKTFHQQAAHQLVQWCKRRGCGKMTYDYTDQSFLTKHDWTGLALCVASKCEEAGIELEIVKSKEVKEE